MIRALRPSTLKVFYFSILLLWLFTVVDIALSIQLKIWCAYDQVVYRFRCRYEFESLLMWFKLNLLFELIVEEKVALGEF